MPILTPTRSPAEACGSETGVWCVCSVVIGRTGKLVLAIGAGDRSVRRHSLVAFGRPGGTVMGLRVAAVQAAPVWMDREATVEKAVGLVKQAASEGAQVARFPRRSFRDIRGGLAPTMWI
jgi:hypothetical protein